MIVSSDGIWIPLQHVRRKPGLVGEERAPNPVGRFIYGRATDQTYRDPTDWNRTRKDTSVFGHRRLGWIRAHREFFGVGRIFYA